MAKKIKTDNYKEDSPFLTGSQTRIFRPFRAVGYVANDIPFDLQIRGDTYFVTTCIGNSFHIYDCAKLNLKYVGTQTEKPITAIASYGDTIFVSCGKDLIAFKFGKEISRYHGNHQGNIFFLSIFGNYIIALSEDNIVILWDHKSGELYSEIQFDENFTVSTVIHPSTYLNKVLLGSRQGTMQIWNIRTKKLKYSFSSFGSSITSLVQSPVVDVIAIGLLDGTIIIHNIKLDERIMSFKQEGRVTSITFRTDDRPIMAAANMYGDITLWNLDEKRLLHIIKGAHEGLIPSIQFLNGQPILLTSGADNSIKEWIFDTLDGVEPRLLKSRSGHHAPPTKIEFYGSDGHFIMSAAGDRSLRIFSLIRDSQSVELSQGSILKKFNKSKDHIRSIDTLKLPQITQFSSSEVKQKEWDNVISCHINNNGARTWSFQSKAIGKHVLRTLDGSYIKVSSISACGNFGFIGSSSGYIGMYNMQSGIHRRTFAGEDKHMKAISGIASDALNRIVISSSLDGTIKIWDFNTAKIKSTIKIGSPISALRFHTENDLLAIVSDDLCIRIIDIETNKIIREFWGHKNRITDLIFSPDGRWIVSTSLDATVRTWDLPTGHLIDIFRVENVPTSVTFSPNGDFLATSHVDLVGIFLWVNTTLFSNVTLRRIADEEDISLVELPTTLGIEDNSEDLFAFNSNEVNDVSFETPEQLTEQMITLSSLPKSKWQNLLNLETIKKRNKPKEPPKAPERPPFFLPTLPGVDPKFIPALALNESEEEKKQKSDKTLKLNEIKIETEFLKVLKKNHSTGEYAEFFNFAKTLNPSAIDFELRTLSLDNNFEDLRVFLDAIKSRLKSKKDFELVQAYLNHFLKIYGDIISGNHELLGSNIESILNEHKKEWSRIDELLHYNNCILEFFRK
ncbi:Utp21 specific WD40 associated putative domain-containing protein [Gigaspora rosea]|uniref:Utp21 specific WD40 associated putative domain-containing protein n=1 Tax=Gigaspora rosea TaxID=44941 RepID=A0A397V1B0_9GLOM|nr:Utp21 specific WD40 associated putative domain-containing protein [Gigaspora rosea]